MIKKSDLDQFNGTMQYHRSSFNKLLLTDGIDFLRHEAHCFWLIDIIETANQLKLIEEYNGFLIWKIEVNKDNSYKITARTDTTEPAIYEQFGRWTDFPFEELEFYQIKDVLLLKSEY